MKNMDKRQKILIVDDAKFNRDILKEILWDTYNYLEAENGNQAIQMIGENIGIDLMLLDINMPQMNGGTIGTGTVAHNVSILARYVFPVKKSESSIKELSGFFVWMQSSWKKQKFENLSHQGH